MTLYKTQRPLSPSEDWYVSRYEENPEKGKLSVVPIAIDLGTAIPKTLIEKVIETIVARNDIFLTEYVKKDKTAALMYDAEEYFKVKNLITYKKTDLTDPIQVLENECRKGIHIYDETYRFIIYEDEIQKSRIILMVFHHLVFDWDSIYLLQNQLMEVMKYLSAGNELSKVGKYHDYVNKILSKFTEDKKQQIQTYWSQLLSANAETVFNPDATVNAEEMGVYIFELKDEQKTRLKKIARENRASEFIVLFAITALSIKKITNKTNFIINTPYSNRYFMCEKPTIGVMLYSTVIKFTQDALESFEKCIAHLKQQLAKAFDHQPVTLNYLQKIIRENDNDLQLFFNHQFHQPTALSSNSTNLGIKTIPLFEKTELTKSISPFAMETLAFDNTISVRISHQKRYVKQAFLNEFENIFLSFIK
jgi:hypothetical protein